MIVFSAATTISVHYVFEGIPMQRTFFLLLIATQFSACGNESNNLPASSANWQTLSGERPIVIAHRGASAYLPGHTLEAYELGIDQGADFIEPDLVLTKDNVLVCRHDRYLSTTTNIADHLEFADRRVEKDGRVDWWVEDFTVAEIKTLRSREDSPHRSKLNDDKFTVPTFDEVIELVKRKSDETGRIIGINPEPKQAEQYAAAGRDITAALVASLERAGWTGPDAPVIIQSFEAAVLKELNEQIDVPLIQLTLSKTFFAAGAAHESFIELDTIPEYADGVGPSRLLVVHEDGTVTDLIERAHALGLEVHVWTVLGDRNSPDGLSPEDETRRLYDLGVDALFADDPAQAVRIRAERQGRPAMSEISTHGDLDNTGSGLKKTRDDF